MNLRKARALFVGLAFLLAPTVVSFALALDVPPLRGRVNDYAGMLPADRARALEERLTRFEAETGHQIVVLTLPTLQGDSLEDFSIRVAESWKIGKKGFDNGAILLIVRDDRRLRIEVGYGLEGVLPDAIANRIINQVITPRFRSGDFAGGIEAGVDTMFKVTKGEVLPERSRAGGRNAAQGSSLMTIFMITVILALFIGMTSRRLLGGAFGGAASGLVASLFGAGGVGLVLLLAVIVGAVVGAVGSTVGTGSAGNQWTGGSRRGSRGGGIFPGGLGGGGGFGGGGFGDGGGGGFGGGGGGFGGGGASGSW
jgi:uncharacterized protein